MQGYAALASSLLERWSAIASKAAAKVDAGEYTAASAAEDLTSSMSLATEGGLLWAAETLEACAGTGGLQGAPRVVTSRAFRAPAGAALKLAGPLVKGPMLDSLPVSAVSIRPPKLGATETEFTLHADPTGHCGATYVGTVNATTDAGTVPVRVWIVVP